MDLQTWFYLVLGLVYLVAQANKGSKKGKKQQNENQPQTQPQERDWEKEVEDMLKRVVGMEKPKVEKPVQAVKKTKPEIKRSAQPEGVPQSNSYDFALHEKQQAAEKIRQDNILLFDEGNVDKNPILEDFDPRKAFIYSEIFRPKYLED